jgi:hypothetical protein
MPYDQAAALSGLTRTTRVPKRRAASRPWPAALAWIFPGLALLAPLAGDGSARVLQACLMLGAGLGLGCAARSRAVVPALVWSAVSGLFGARLAFLDAHADPALTVTALFVAAIQALALLAVAGPATRGSWRARGRALLPLAGPLALTMLTVDVLASLSGWSAAVAVALNLAALPLALRARGLASMEARLT